jgi:hypothetical protein
MAPKGSKRSKLSGWLKGSASKHGSSQAPSQLFAKDEAAEAAVEGSRSGSEAKLYDLDSPGMFKYHII